MERRNQRDSIYSAFVFPLPTLLSGSRVPPLVLGAIWTTDMSQWKIIFVLCEWPEWPAANLMVSWICSSFVVEQSIIFFIQSQGNSQIILSRYNLWHFIHTWDTASGQRVTKHFRMWGFLYFLWVVVVNIACSSVSGSTKSNRWLYTGSLK